MSRPEADLNLGGAVQFKFFTVPADRWGLHLERPHTLGGGADHCDFRLTKQSNS